MSKKRIFLLGSVLFILFIAFSYLVHKNIFLQSDFDTTIRLQDHMPRRFDEFFSLLSLVGSFEITGTILAIILLVAAIFRKKIVWAISVGILFGGIHLVELYGKTFVHHLPPPRFMLRTQLPFDFPQFYVREQNSYPSGHAARAFFVSTVVVLLAFFGMKIPKQKKLLLVGIFACYDILMCISRVYLAEHWTTDVIGGSLLGTGLALLSVMLL